jgi:hypothetical protein
MRALIIICLLLPTLAHTQAVSINSPSPISSEYYLRLYSQSNGTLAPSLSEVNSFIQKLESRTNSFKTDKTFLHHIFVKAHQQFLSSFEPYASFSELLTDGSYNCLTATALYGVLLDHFNFDYKVVETNDHIFILCDTDAGKVLLETTDYESGFVDNPLAMEKRIASYEHSSVQRTNTKTYFRGSFEIMDTVKMTGMLGLLHYNHAARAYNEGRYDIAIAHLHHGFLLHRSIRMEELASILTVSITHNEKLHPAIKSEYLEKIQAMQKKNSRWAD